MKEYVKYVQFPTMINDEHDASTSQWDKTEECHWVVPAPQHVVSGLYPNERPSVPTLPSLNHHPVLSTCATAQLLILNDTAVG